MDSQMNYSPIGNRLVALGFIRNEDLIEAIAVQRTSGGKLGQILVQMGKCTEADVSLALSSSTGFEFLALNDKGIDLEAARLITPEIARKYKLIPISLDGDILSVAMIDPNDIVAKDDLKLLTGCQIRPIVAPDSEISVAIENFANFYTSPTIQTEDEDLVIEKEDSTNSDEENPAIMLTNQVLHSAIRVGASDIHIEPSEKVLRVRYRIDGVLHESGAHPMRMHPSLISRIKVMGGMDIAERRIPQDGRATIKLDNRTVDIRIASLPSIYGEKLTLRLLMRDEKTVTVHQLGLADANQQKIDDILKTPYGFVLVTGPTGSGKSTTLYAALAEINSAEKNIITLEDPVERRINGITQVQINNRAGMTFASGLRSILRSDPDVVMVGEVRDLETGKIAVEAALTGHLVFATLHTNDAPSTITRLGEMGIEPFLVSSSLVAVVAQRLVRVLCPVCKQPIKIPREKLLHALPDFPIEPHETEVEVYQSKGCIACNQTGYKGRKGVYEILKTSKEIQDLILKDGSVNEMRDTAIAQGMVTLRQDGFRIIREGYTSIEELLRVIV